MILFLKALFYTLFDSLVSIRAKSSPSSQELIIVKLDAIGDYVLFRNYLKSIKESPKYKNWKVTLVGNALWKDLATHLDTNEVDSFIWINKKQYMRNLNYRASLISKLREKSYDVLMAPTFSRTYFDDLINRSIPSQRKITWKGDQVNQSNFYQTISNSFYHELVETTKLNMFEFQRNNEFFTKVLSLNLKDLKLSITSSSPTNDSNYIVVFPGAGVEFRQWSWKKFAGLIKLLVQEYSGKVILAGGPADVEVCENISDQVGGHQIEVHAGKSPLHELPKLLSQATALISNETGAVHLAAAVNCPSICISNGNHFGRFNPYPSVLNKKVWHIYPRLIADNIENFAELIRLYGHGSELDINTITIEEVFNIYKNQIERNHEV